MITPHWKIARLFNVRLRRCFFVETEEIDPICSREMSIQQNIKGTVMSVRLAVIMGS